MANSEEAIRIRNNTLDDIKLFLDGIAEGHGIMVTYITYDAESGEILSNCPQAQASGVIIDWFETLTRK